MKRLMLLVFLLAVAVSVGCTETEYHSGDSGSIGDADLTILSHDLQFTDGGWAVVVGEAVNNSDERLSHAAIDARFYDGDGYLLSRSLDVINDLDPGRHWRFEIRCFNDDVASYDIAVGSCW